MKIPLAEFEQFIDETILKRGFSYFNNGAVLDVVEISTGEYEAIVSGTENYTVQLEIKTNAIVNHNCDCPYDLGPVCKHVVATIFYLQRDVLDFDKKSPSKPRAKRTKSVAQQIKELLKSIPHDELIQFIEDQGRSDKKFRASFLATFGHLSQDISKAFYQKQIQATLRAAKGRDSWISWSNMRYVVNTTEPLLATAEKYLENNHFEEVFFISTALLEEFTEALEFADDSNGEIGYFIDASLELMSKITLEKLPASLRTELFDYCISSFTSKIFSGWGWHMDMLDFASKLVANEKEANVILKCLDTVKGDYYIEEAQSLKLILFRQFRPKKEVDDFITAHIKNPSIRTQEIELAFAQKNYERAIQLSNDGIEANKKEKPGLVKNWYNWLLKVAQAQKDTSKIIAYARYLYIDNFYPDQDYYQILKTTIKKEDWHPFLETLIAEITASRTRWSNSESVRKIYIEEQWWERLFAMVKQNASLGSIEQNESLLASYYSAELVELYAQEIVNYLENNIGRNHYQGACRYLRRMKKLGGQEQVTQLIENLKAKYPKRKALMEELGKV